MVQYRCNACLVDGCNREVAAVGLCLCHYQRMRKHGTLQLEHPIGEKNGHWNSHPPGSRPTGTPTRSLEQFRKHFWSCVSIGEPNECWLWLRALDDQGYGTLSWRYLSQQPISTHRVAWFLTHGELPSLLVMHSCDTPPCVNPKHLSLGTHLDNARDKIAKGRARQGHLCGDNHPWRQHPELVPRGTAHGMCKLSEAQVIEIISILNSTEYRPGFDEKLAKCYGVTKYVVYSIRKCIKWKHIPRLATTTMKG